MRILAHVVVAILLICAWSIIVFTGTNEGWWRNAIAEEGDAAGFTEAVKQAIEHESNGNVAYRLIESGEIVGEYYQSIGEPVDQDTLFQVASLSKWITAWGVMRLVDEGKLDLDAPVSTYLSRWQLPESEFDDDGVTVRRLLSHTAGLIDGLGYGGFEPGVQIQTLEASLTRAIDASPNADGRTMVGIEPGTEWKYSGGGYTLMQLLIEEISGKAFNTYMTETVFEPLGMNRSTFIVDANTSNVAEFYDIDRSVAIHYRFTGLAAASLYTSVADLTQFLAAHVAGSQGEPIGRGVLKPETVANMREPHGFQAGYEIWGLGTMLLVPDGAGDFIIGHDGNNDPAINTTARIDPRTGDGFIMLASGTQLLPTRLGGEWVFWKASAIDFLTFTIEMNRMLVIMGIGWIVILLLTVVNGIYRSGRSQPESSA